MIRYILGIFLFLSFSVHSISQSQISDYSYVVVPDLYDFLNERDQYELNSMTKFLFNKYGCNAYFINELPNVKRCDGLYADVIKSGNFIYTKLTVVVKDCNGFVIYKGLEGRSKLKDYKQSYYEALRGAFESFASLDIHQKELAIYDDDKADPAVAIATGSTASNSLGPKNLPDSKYSNYTLNGNSYLLRKTAEGYSLYEESSSEEDGLVLIGKLTTDDSNLKFTKASGGEVLEASFDSSSNLIIGMGYSKLVYNAIR